jgi:transcriptional regulator with XRE-family HTH domain
MTRVDASFGPRLRELRQGKRLSLRRLGQIVHCSHGYLWDLEVGAKRPSAAVAALLDAALDADGGLSALVAGASTGGVSDYDAMHFAADWRDGVGAAADLWGEDVRRRSVLRQVGFSAVAFVPPAMRWLMSPLDERPIGRGERLVGDPDVEMVRRITSTYRALDNQYGGGRVRESIIRFLDGDVAPLIHGRYDADTGRALLSAVAETTQLAAWASYDAGLHGLAQRYLVQALRFSAGAGDRPLGAEILAAMSHQAAYKRASVEAVDLARAAGRAAAETGVPAIQAESAVLEAQGHAVGGDELACAMALDRAEKLFDKADRAGDPQWISYFDEAYLAAKFGHCFAALERGDIARRFASRSLEMDGMRYVRGRQFNLALLALTYVQTGEPEEASRAGLQALEAAEQLESARARDYLTQLADRLGRHVGLPVVREFLERV